MTSEAPDVWYVMLRDEASAGRIVVPLDSFLRFNRRMKKQLARVERRVCRAIPQLAKRGLGQREARLRRPESS